MEVDEGVDLSVIKAGKQHPHPRPYSHTKICSDHPSFFVPNIGHFLFRTSGKMLLCSIVDSDHPVI